MSRGLIAPTVSIEQEETLIITMSIFQLVISERVADAGVARLVGLISVVSWIALLGIRGYPRNHTH